MKFLKYFLLVCPIAMPLLQATLPRGIIQLTTGAFSEGGQIKDVKIDSSGRIFACGYTLVSGQQQWTVACFSSNGSLDTSFNASGTPGYQRWNSNGSIANAMVIQSDGKIVAVGVSGGGLATFFRYKTDGTLDTGVGVNGIDISGGQSNSAAVGVAIDNSNTYIVCSQMRATSTLTQSLVSRITISDLSINLNTPQTVKTGSNSWQANTFAGGACMLPTSNDFIETGYFFTANGVARRFTYPYTGASASQRVLGADNTFNNTAAINATTVAITNHFSTSNRLFIFDSTFSSVIAVVNITLNSSSYPYAVGGGLTLTEYDNPSSSYTRALVCASSTANSSTPQPFISKINLTSASLDPTYGTNGITIQTQSELTPGFYAAVALQSNGKAVVGGFSGNNSYWVLSRYETNGTLDPTFGLMIGALQDTAAPFNTDQNAVIYGECIDQDNNITMCGNYDNAWTLVKYTADGERYNGFGSNGVVLDNLLGVANAYAIIQDTDGNYFVAGESTVNGTTVLTVVKYANDGSLITTFGVNGIAQLTTHGQSRAFGIVLNQNGILFIAGQVTANNILYPALIVYDPSGNPINAFGANGVQVYNEFGTGKLCANVNSEIGNLVSAGQMGDVATLLQTVQESDAAAYIHSGL